MVKIPSLSRRSDPATRDENLDGRADGRHTRDADPDRTPDGSLAGGPTVADRDADRTTYRSGAAATGGRVTTADRRAADVADADRRAGDRTTVDADRRAADRTPADADRRVADRRPADADRGDGTTLDADRRAADRAAVARAATVRPELGERRPDPDATLERPVDQDLDRDRAVAPVTERDETVRPAAPGPRPRTSLLTTLGLVLGIAGALFVLTGTLAGYGIGLGAIGAVLAVLGLVATRRRHVAGTTDALLGVGFGLAAVVLGVLAMTGQFDWPTTDGDWVQRFREWLDSQFVDRL